MRDGEQLFFWGLGISVIVFILGSMFFLGWLSVHGINNSRAKDLCGERGGIVTYSPEPHAKDWRCVGATAERAP